MGLIRGQTVYIHVRTETGRDALNRPVYADLVEPVENVLIAPLSQTGEEILSEISLSGKKVGYLLAIPKGDLHDWEDTLVDFWGHTWQTSGYSTQGMDHQIPLAWNRKVVVERVG